MKHNMKLYFSFLPDTFDLCSYFVKIMANLNSPISSDFKDYLVKMHLGNNPETLIQEYRTPSSALKNYLNNLLNTNFRLENMMESNIQDIENSFKQFTNSLESRMSIFFFLGVFIPLGLSLSLIISSYNPILFFVVLLLFFFVLRGLTRSFIRKNSFLLSISLYDSKEIREEYQDFLKFLSLLSINLLHFNPENAIIKAYENTSRSFQEFLFPIVLKLKTFNYSLESFLAQLFDSLKGKKTQLLCESLNIMLTNDSYNAAINLKAIIKTIKRHLLLEQERTNIIKGQNFKVKVFQFILPLIVGIFSGILPIMTKMVADFDYDIGMLSLPFEISNLTQMELILLIIMQIVCVLISCIYFSRSIGDKMKVINLITILLIFICSYALSSVFINLFTLNLI
ncbi:MAG: hypothetical protein GF364_07775 [Candidatus Lokiarchaeota archaeon]|nr:hypothetical protein [Candidatus Lokiarchaeota archaeon]